MDGVWGKGWGDGVKRTFIDNFCYFPSICVMPLRKKEDQIL